MFEQLKIWVRQRPVYYSAASTLYALTVGLRSVIKLGLLKHALLTHFRRDKIRLVIIYCFFPSHYQNVKNIAELLAADGRNCRVNVFCHFPNQEYKVVIDSPNIFVQQGISYHACRLFRAELFITPMVGLSPSSMPMGSRSVHFLVSLAGLDGVYLDHHFDGWDYIFCAGEHQIKDFKRLSMKRNLKGTVLIRGGYPKLDDQMMVAHRSMENTVANSIIYAPTHVYQGNDALASLLSHGESIIDKLIELGVNTIFRPHPASFGHESDMKVIARICDKYRNNDLFHLDNSKDYSGAYSQSKMMITDVSGTGFTFAFAFERPAIFFAPNIEAENGLQGAHFEDRERIGLIVRDIDELDKSLQVLNDNYDAYVSKIGIYRDESVYHVGKSREYFIENIESVLGGHMNSEWVRL